MRKPAIVVHGGAGAWKEGDDPQALAQGCLAAARLGHVVLARGGSALDAVEEAVVAMENDELFNAGRGSALNEAGEVEMDASLMEGHTLRAGAVALVRTVKNPIRLARVVLEKTAHVFIAGEGAQNLAGEAGLPRCHPGDLITVRAQRELERHRNAGVKAASAGGTVGAAAIDMKGRLAAATSTGGITGKRVGRIGDSPVIGAGTYADDYGAVSCTGHGEAIMRVTLAKAACDQLRGGRRAADAAQVALAEVDRVGGSAGLILVARNGELSVAMNTQRMSRAWIDRRGREHAEVDAPRPIRNEARKR